MSDQAVETELARNWDFRTDGDQVDGTFVEIRTGPTKGYGDKPILILDVNGEHRSVWVLHMSLLEKLKDELERRETTDFTVGERIVITRGERTRSANDRMYVPHLVGFPDGPKRSATAILSTAVLDPEAE